jgi:dTMP kinase
VTGKFITLEGIEGVGKSTHLKFVASWLREQGHSVVVTREPGGTPIAEQIRSVILEGSTDKLPPLAELLLMFAARAAHLETLIRPALSRGEWVVCDRFIDASYAYQGAGRGLSMEIIEELEAIVQQGLRPDLTILLDVPLAVSSRRRARRDQRDRFEREQDPFFERVQTAYREIAAREPERVRTVLSDRPLEEVQADIAAIMSNFVQ